jgi:hypothetical protein
MASAAATCLARRLLPGKSVYAGVSQQASCRLQVLTCQCGADAAAAATCMSNVLDRLAQPSARIRRQRRMDRQLGSWMLLGADREQTSGWPVWKVTVSASSIGAIEPVEALRTAADLPRRGSRAAGSPNFAGFPWFNAALGRSHPQAARTVAVQKNRWWSGLASSHRPRRGVPRLRRPRPRSTTPWRRSLRAISFCLLLPLSRRRAFRAMSCSARRTR